MIDPDSSTFVDHWTDEAHRARYTFHARENYEQSKALRLAAQTGHMEYGKWLMASMLAIHGGAIYALSGLRSDISKSALPAIITAAEWHMAGIGFIVLAGFMAWLNFQCAEQVYFSRINPATVYRTDAAIDDPYPGRDPVSATLFLAAATGLLSFFCLVAGASEAFQAMRQSLI